MASNSDGIPYEKFADGKTVDISDEIPFAIPPTWRWVKLKNICDYGSCNNIDAKFIYRDSWMLELEDIEKDSGMISRRILKKDRQTVSTKHKFSISNVLYSKLRPYLNKVIIADTDGFCSSEIIPMDLIGIYPPYAQIFLMSPFFVNYANENSYGVKMPRLETDEARNAFFTLPPLAEQQRIVAKIEELLPHIERYGKAEVELGELQIRFPEELKKSILQSAIQGKLVPQDQTDEPAEVLLERIRTEKVRLIKSGKIKPSKNESTIFRASDRLHYERCGTETRCIEEELPFQIPDSWQWVRLGEIATIIRGSGIKRDEVSSAGVQCVRYGEVYTTYDVAFVNAVSHVPSQIAEKCKHIKCGDVLCTLTGESKNEIGKSTAYLGNGDVVIGGDLATITDHHCDPMYLAYFMYSPFAIIQKAKSSNGDIIVHISGEKLKNILLPLPPITEQKRIVAQIEKFLCYKEELSG